jgi:ferritin-like metal-binding protein YciE
MASPVLTFHALLIDEMQDLLFAENHLVKALPKMAKAATNPALKAGFTSHLAQTRGHLTRLAQALKLLGLPPKGKTCHAMLGLIEEGREAIELKGPPSVRDAALIGAAQRVEHYEIAGYGTARAFAEALGEGRVAGLLQETLDEEGDTNKKLTEISLVVNADALAVGGRIPITKRARKSSTRFLS